MSRIIFFRSLFLSYIKREICHPWSQGYRPGTVAERERVKCHALVRFFAALVLSHGLFAAARLLQHGK